MPQAARYSNFGGGINNNSPADQINDNEVVDALNVVFDKRSNFQTRGGLSKVNSNKNLSWKTEVFEDWIIFGTGVLTPNTDNDPNDNLTADTFEGSVSGLAFAGLIYPHNIIIADGDKFTVSIHIKKRLGGAFLPGIGVFFYDTAFLYPDNISYGVVFDNINLNFALPIDLDDSRLFAPIGGPTTTFTPTIPTNIFMEELDDDWLRIGFSFTNNSVGNDVLQVVFYPGISLLSNPLVPQEFISSQIVWGGQLESGLLSDYHKNDLPSETPTLTGHFLSSKITSILDYRNSDGTSAVYVTSGNLIWKLNSSFDYFESFPAGLTLPDDTYWQWVMYDNMAIGVNRANTASGKHNPIKITNATGGIAALTGSPPKGNYIAIWNDRIWIADADNPNVVQCSSLGLPENWTNTGKAGSQSFEIGDEEASAITGMIAHKDRLFIFKSDKTYYIAPGSPNTDIEQYEIILLSGSIGCISGYSIQSIIDDVVFLSRHGLTSLSSVEQFGNFTESVISNNVKELNDFTHDDINTASIINPYESQYWIAAPLGGGPVHSALYIMDYTSLQEKVVGFTRFTGKILGATFSSVIFEGRKRIYIGGYPQFDDNGNVYLYRYEPNRYNDDGSYYKSSITTKAYNLGDSFISKIVHRIFAVFEIITGKCSIGITYLFDENKSKQKHFVTEFEGLVFVGGKWGQKWGSMIWASRESLERRVKRKLIGSPGRLCKSIQFVVSTINKDEALIIKDIGFDFDVASFHKES